MRLSLQLTAFSLIVGCAGVPAKPKIELCLVDYPATEVICGVTTKESIDKLRSAPDYTQLRRLVMAASTERKPLAYIDRGVALIPSEYEKLKNYIDELNIYIEQQCNAKP